MTSAAEPAANNEKTRVAHRAGLNQRLSDLKKMLMEYVDVYQEQAEDNPTADIQTNIAHVLAQSNKKIDEYRHTYADVFSDADLAKASNLIEDFRMMSNKIVATQQANKQAASTDRVTRKNIIAAAIQNYIVARDQIYTHHNFTRLHRQPAVSVIIDRFSDLKNELATFARDAEMDFERMELAFIRAEHHFPSANLTPLYNEIKSKAYHLNVEVHQPDDEALALYGKIAALSHHGSKLMQSRNAKDRAFGQFTFDLATSLSTKTHELFDNKKLTPYQKANLKEKIEDLLKNDDIINNAHRAKAGKLLHDIMIGLALLIPLGIPAAIYKLKTGNNPFKFFTQHPTERQADLTDIKQEFARVVSG